MFLYKDSDKASIRQTDDEVRNWTTTYPLVPRIPELRDADVKAYAEGECAGEDRRDEDTYGAGMGVRDVGQTRRSTNASFGRSLTVASDEGVVKCACQLSMYIQHTNISI